MRLTGITNWVDGLTGVIIKKMSALNLFIEDVIENGFKYSDREIGVRPYSNVSQNGLMDWDGFDQFKEDPIDYTESLNEKYFLKIDASPSEMDSPKKSSKRDRNDSQHSDSNHSENIDALNQS